MPGLILLTEKKPHAHGRNRHVVRKMAKEAMHEPFYRQVFVEVEEMGLHAANIYLDHENPQEKLYADQERGIICLLNGELFGRGELVSALGVSSGRPPALLETLVRLYEQEGPGFVARLNGCFTLLIVDRKNRRMLLANDRLGLHRQYWCRTVDGGIVLAPESKCCKIHPELKLTLNPAAIVEYFKYDTIIQGNTFYQEVSRLPNATLFCSDPHGERLEEYWSLESVLGKGELPENELLESALHTFEEIVDEYHTPEKTGMSLTGGWDTRAILSVFQHKGINLPCYTFGGPTKDSLDVKIARRLASLAGNPFEKIVIGDEFVRNIDHWANRAIRISDGNARISDCYEYYANLQARKFGPIRLTGKFGSQIFRGVTMLRDRSPNLKIFSRDFRPVYARTSQKLRYDGIHRIIKEELPLSFGCRQTQEVAAMTVRTPYTDNRLTDLLLRAPSMPDTSRLQKRIILRNSPGWQAVPTNRGEFVRSLRHAPLVRRYFRFLNLMDAAYNWERLPAYALPVCTLGDLSGISGFFNGQAEYRHFRNWFLRDMRGFAREILLDRKTLSRPWYDRSSLERMGKMHFAGFVNHTYEIDKVISLELWLRQNAL